MDIMEEGCGSHFDPTVFAAFMAVEQAFHQVAEMNRDDPQYPDA
jgi:HD-GYP domain-containing protein (c-di-GMP phosphodiesterase class II)